MGKTGTVLDIDDKTSAIVKLDKEGKDYQEVKQVKLDYLGKTLAEDDSLFEKTRDAQIKFPKSAPKILALPVRKLQS